jgi:signal peptidase I
MLALAIMPLVVLLLLALLSATLIVVTVHGDSMAPALLPGDRVLVLRRWATRRLKRGDVVVARVDLPLGGRLLIKRIGALGGDRAVSRNQEIILSDREVFLVGDHREASFDSRQYGAFPIDGVIGRSIHHFPARRAAAGD